MVAVRTFDLAAFHSEEEARPATNLPAEPEYFLGKAVSTLTGATGNLAIERPDKLRPVPIGTHTQHLTIISTYTELERYLSFSSSGSGVMYGVQLEGSSAYLERERNVQYGMYAIVRVSARTHSFSFLARELREVCRREIPTNNEDLEARESFYEKWGDAYVQKVVYGGELVVVIELTRNSYSQYKALEAELSGNYMEVYKGSAEYESTSSLIMKKGQVKASVLVRGRNIDPPIAVSARGDEAIYDAQALFKYVDGFGAKVRKEDVAEAMEFELGDLKTTDNWPVAVNPISVDDAVYRDQQLADLLIEAEKLQIQWIGFIEQPSMFEVEGARENPDLLLRKRTEAQGLLQNMQGVIRRIREERRDLERRPLAFDRATQHDWGPDFHPYRLVPLMKRTTVPTIVTRAFQIKYHPSGGNGHAPNQNKTYTVDASNSPRLNWFPSEGTGRLHSSISALILEARRSPLIWDSNIRFG